MTAKQDLNSRPEAVSIVVGMLVYQLAAGERNRKPSDADFERYTARALKAWDQLRADMPHLSEAELAEQTVEILRQTLEWGPFLRAGTQ